MSFGEEYNYEVLRCEVSSTCLLISLPEVKIFSSAPELKHPESKAIHTYTCAKPNVRVNWLALLLRTREVPSSNPILWLLFDPDVLFVVLVGT
jgi:hypothetical protein